jgi:hypothetical protein
MGRRILTYDEGWRSAGAHSRSIGAEMLTAGQYLLVLDAADGSAQTKFIRE